MSADLDPLLTRYLAGDIDAAEMARLNALLAADADARRRFAEELNLDSTLARHALEWRAEECAPPRSEAAPRWRPGRAAARAVAAVAAGLALAAWIFGEPDFARVEKAAGIPQLAPGARLRGERHAFAGGTLALVTVRGASVVIEAPAEFQFESAQRLRLTRGRLSAVVPPAAKGFTVVTPSGVAVDLGTRFGVDVPAAGDAEVHVFEGEVIAQAARDRRNLRTGDAVAMTTGGHYARDVRAAAFIQSDEVGDLTAGLAAGQRARAEATLARLREDPDLIALLDFEEGGESGEFRTVQGRWPGSRAPEFTRIGDHAKLDLGGNRTWPRLTLAAWVRLDRLDAPYQSLLHTDGWTASNPGQVHWMVNRFSTMRLALRGNTLAAGSPEPDSFPDSRTPVLPEIGRWVHLAVVYDSIARTTRFFLNGRFDNESREAIAHPARFGPSRIGNWDRVDRKLSGRVDEMVILGRAMTDTEVESLFAAGNPYH